jgi:hypothetical protein
LAAAGLAEICRCKDLVSIRARGIAMEHQEDDGKYQIVGYRTHREGYWVQDPDQKTELPAGTTRDQVVDRMIAILQDAARK